MGDRGQHDKCPICGGSGEILITETIKEEHGWCPRCGGTGAESPVGQALGHLSNLGMELENLRLDTEADTDMAAHYLQQAMDALENAEGSNSEASPHSEVENDE